MVGVAVEVVVGEVVVVAVVVGVVARVEVEVGRTTVRVAVVVVVEEVVVVDAAEVRNVLAGSCVYLYILEFMEHHGI